MRTCLSLLACAAVLAGCRAKKQEPASDAASPASAATAALTVTQASWTPEVLDELVAPIALYPDALVGQILAASVNPQEVLDAGNWLLENQSLKGAELDAAAQKAGLGGAVRALLSFPSVLDMMCQEMDWTRQLGSAFTSDQKAVLDAVQRKRAQAADVGNLKSTPQQTVEKKSEGGKTYVEVKPADPTIVYVPQYDPTVVYTTPPSAAPAAPVATAAPAENTVGTGTAVAGALLAFGVGMMVGSAMHDDYYPHWGSGVVFVGPRPFYPPAYVYRPVYGPAFRPGYRYAPPASYRYRYNSPTNVVINNNNYYNRFNQQNNLRRGGVPATTAATRQAGAGPRLGQTTGAGRQDDWKGRQSYAGARKPTAAGHRAGTAGQQARTTERGSGTAPRSSGAAQRKVAAAEPRAGGARPSATQSRPSAAPSARTTNARDRGYAATPAADRGATAKPSPSAKSASHERPEHAFTGAGGKGSGDFDRAASARGRASEASTGGHAGRRARQG